MSWPPVEGSPATILQVEVFRSHFTRLLMATVFGLFALLGLAGVVEAEQTGPGTDLFAWAIVVVNSWLAVRGWRSGTLIATADEVRYRSLVRTRKWRATSTASKSVMAVSECSRIPDPCCGWWA